MATKASDFPFTIMDVVELLRLHIRRRSPDYIYADCPLCGSQRGKLCINLTKNAWCTNCCGDSGGMLALYSKAQNVSKATAYSEICDAILNGGISQVREASQKERMQSEVVLSERASTQEIHQTYSTLLGMLQLIPAHRKHLQEKRGLTDEQIAAFGFKSTPAPYLCRTLTAKLIQQGCTVQGVPGFYMDDSGKWTVKFHQRTSGILIPYRNVDGMIHGLQIRLDRPLKKEGDPPDKVGTKYLWLASTSKTCGASSGSPIHFVGDPCSRVVYVTEGALKADIAHVLMNRTFAATGGAGCISSAAATPPSSGIWSQWISRWLAIPPAAPWPVPSIATLRHLNRPWSVDMTLRSSPTSATHYKTISALGLRMKTTGTSGMNCVRWCRLHRRRRRRKPQTAPSLGSLLW